MEPASIPTSKKPASASPLHGYYAVRKGKGGLRDCIFVSWDRAKEFVAGDNPKKVEFSFFAKWEDAVQYIQPMTTSGKSYADLCSDAGKDPLPLSKKQLSSPNKRKRLAVLTRPLKKIRIPTHNKAAVVVDVDADGEKEENKDDGSSVEQEASEAADDNQVASPSSGPLIVLLEQGFHQNFPKGWRSQNLGLYLTRRDHFREPALKQYLQDLVELQNYRETNNIPARSTVTLSRHFSGASHPLSVYYLNFSWGVSQSYHRDIRRQQKNKPPNLEGVELPHFKSHSLPRPPTKVEDGNASDDDGKNNNNKSSAEQTAMTTSVVTPESGLPYVLERAYLGFRHGGWRARQISAAKQKQEQKQKQNGDVDDETATSDSNQEKRDISVAEGAPGYPSKEEPKSKENGSEGNSASGNNGNPNNGSHSQKAEENSEGSAGINGGENSNENIGEGMSDNPSRELNSEDSSKEGHPDNVSIKKKPKGGSSENATEEVANSGKPDNGKGSERSAEMEKAVTSTKNEVLGTIATPEMAGNKANCQELKNSSSNYEIPETTIIRNGLGDDDDATEIQYQKDLEELKVFRRAHPQEIQRYRGLPIAQNHPSGIPSPFSIRYLKWSWGKDTVGEGNDDDDTATDADETVANGESKYGMPTKSLPRPGGAAQANLSFVTSSSSSSQPTPSLAMSVAGLIGITGGGETIDDDTPPLIESLRANWFAMKDKGWRAAELGFPQGGTNRKYNSNSRKEREQQYLFDLEVLKQWWKTYPSSQHYVFTVPDEEDFHEEGIDRSKFPYGRSGKNNNCKFDRRHKSGINAPWSLTFLNWSWGVSNSYNRDLVRKEKRKVKQESQQALYI